MAETQRDCNTYLIKRLGLARDRLGWYDWRQENYVKDMQFLTNEIMDVLDLLIDNLEEK